MIWDGRNVNRDGETKLGRTLNTEQKLQMRSGVSERDRNETTEKCVISWCNDAIAVKEMY